MGPSSSSRSALDATKGREEEEEKREIPGWVGNDSRKWPTEREIAVSVRNPGGGAVAVAGAGAAAAAVEVNATVSAPRNGSSSEFSAGQEDVFAGEATAAAALAGGARGEGKEVEGDSRSEANFLGAAGAAIEGLGGDVEADEVSGPCMSSPPFACLVLPAV